ncbi:MAG TPA: TonB-dependent receptor [Candidatus Eremiobacteraceae bacterium]|jgi:hypothetical protein
MNGKILRGVFGVALVLGLVFGQETRVLAGSTGQITGKVTDSVTGAAVAGAGITAVSPSGTYRTTTDARGDFAVVNVYPDTYRVTASAAGYQTAMSDGNSVIQNNSAVVNIALSKQLTVLSHVTVRGATSVVQPSVTADQYVLTASAANSTNGSGGSMSLYQTPGIIGTLPGVTLDSGGTAHIRGGRLEEVGYEYDGLTTIEPVTGTFATNLVEDGISRIQVSTGGYDASGGNSISGVVNTVVGVGTYPAHGSVTTLVQGPTFYHGLNFDYGSATPDGRFSWYAAAVTWNSGYNWGDRNTFYPGPESAETASIGELGSVMPSRDEVLNLHYRFGPNNDNDIQYLGTTGIEHYNNTLQALFFPSMNPADGAVATSPSAVGGICNNGIGLFPGQSSCTESATPGMTDHDDQGYFIDKLGWTHNFGPSSALSMHYARVNSYVTFAFPFGDGAFDDLWENRHSDQQELFAEYTSQLNAQNLIKFGGQSIYSTNNLTIALPSSGIGEVEPANNRDGSYWISDTIKPTDKLDLDISGRRDTRTYYRVAAPTFTDGVNQLRGSFTYTLTPGTVIRGSDGNFAELPYDSRVELFETAFPNFFDYSPSNRIAVLREAEPDVPQSHLYDFSVEHDFGNGMAIKAGPFYRKSDNLVLTFHNPGQPAALPTAVGPYFVNGFEGEWQFNHVGNGVSGFINYTHMRALAVVPGDYNQSVPLGAKYAGALFPVSFVPPNTANLVMNIRHNRWLINPVINYIGGYPYGVGKFTYADSNCPGVAPDPTQPKCGTIIPTNSPDPNESLFADGRVCCSTLLYNLNLYYDLSNQTNVGVQIQNLTGNYRPTFLESNPFNGNPFVNYGPSPYIPGSVPGSQEFLLTVTQKI